MKTQDETHISDKFDRLRRQAESLITDRRPAASAPAEDMLALVHELEVHQVELELQNEELRKAQLELSDLHHKFEDLYEFAPCAYLSLSPKGLITRINLVGVMLLKRERGRILNSAFSSYVAHELQGAYFTALGDAGRTGELQEVEFQLGGVGDSPPWVWAQIQPDRDEAGSVIQWRMTLSDISSVKKAEKSLREIEANYRQLFNEMISGAMILEVTQYDNKGRPVDFHILKVNAAYEKIAGLSADQAVGRTVLELFPQMEAFWLENADKVMRGEMSVLIEGPFRELDKYLRLGMFKLDDLRIGVTFSDITDHKNLEETLENARTSLERAVEKRTAELQRANRDLLERTEELAARSRALEETNTALKILLSEYKAQGSVLEEKVNVNIDELTRPQLAKLREGKLSDRQRSLLEAAMNSLEQITAPMIRRFILEGSRLTPTEVQVAGLIRQGRTSKDIAESMGVAVSTVVYHRLNIRKRLGLANKKVNLQSYLQSLI